MSAVQSPGDETEGDPINSLKPDEIANISLRAPAYPKGASTYFFHLPRCLQLRTPTNSPCETVLSGLAWESRIPTLHLQCFTPVSALEDLKKAIWPDSTGCHVPIEQLNDVLVIGAGPTGLACAIAAQNVGLRVVLADKAA